MSSGRRAEFLLWALALLLLAAGHGWGRRGASGFTPRERADDVLRVVTWNVGGADGGQPHGLRSDALLAVADGLAELDPDLVLLQEVGDGDLLDELRRQLGNDWAAFRGRGGAVGLVRADSGQRGSATRWSVGGRAGRALRSVGLRLERGAHDWVALGLHADAFSSADRNREVGTALTALLEQSADAHLFVGDLNLDLDLDKRRDLFTDDQHADVETYNWVAERLKDAARGRGATAEPDRRLDYIFVSPAVEIVEAGPWKGRRVATMDHDPVVADLRLR